MSNVPQQQQEGEAETVCPLIDLEDWKNFVKDNAPFKPTWECCGSGDDRVAFALKVDEDVHAFVEGFPTHRAVMAAAARGEDGIVYFATNDKKDVVSAANNVSSQTKEIGKIVRSPSTLINRLLVKKGMEKLSEPQMELIDNVLKTESADIEFTPGSDSIGIWMQSLKKQWEKLPQNLQTDKNKKLHYFEAWTELYQGEVLLGEFGQVLDAFFDSSAASYWNRVVLRTENLPEGWDAITGHLNHATVYVPPLPEVDIDMINAMSATRGVFTWASFEFILNNTIVCVDTEAPKGVHAEIKVLEKLKSLPDGNGLMYENYSDIPVVEIRWPSCPCCAVYFVHYRLVDPDKVRGHTIVSPCPHLPEDYEADTSLFFLK